MANLSFKHFRHCRTAAKTGSIAAASKRLHLAPQSISGHFRELDRQLRAAGLRCSIEREAALRRGAAGVEAGNAEEPVDGSYHVLTLDKRRSDIANRLADFFTICSDRPPAYD